MDMEMSLNNTTSGGSGSMSNGEMTGMDGDAPMAMVFFFSSTTSLFTKTWTPRTTSEFAGTCIFLAFLGVVMRVLLALKPVLEAYLWRTLPKAMLLPQDDAESCLRKEAPTIRHSVRRASEAAWRKWSTWSFRRSLARAMFELLLATVGYLLMLAVMTMNVGYLISVLAGLFLGTFIVGDLASNNSMYEDHHC